MHEMMQYGTLKHLYVCGKLINKLDTSPWRIRTPNQSKLFLSYRWVAENT